MPLVSVIMPMYNAEKLVKQTIDSILGQTFEDFEFLIVDDGSSDKSIDVVQSYSDSRIKLYKNEINIGYVPTLNKLIQIAEGEFIARQDNDDISHRQRLEKQVRYMQKHPQVGLCGSHAKFIGSKNSGGYFHPHTNSDIRAQMVFGNPIVHPSVMIRSELFKGGNPLSYNPDLMPAEDYALWYEISQKAQIVNLKKSLLKYRWHANNTGVLKANKQIQCANAVRFHIIETSLQIKMTLEEKDIHSKACNVENMNMQELIYLQHWFGKIKDVNSNICYYDKKSLDKAIFYILSLSFGNNNTESVFKLIRYYFGSKHFLFKYIFSTSSFKTIVKFALRILRIK